MPQARSRPHGSYTADDLRKMLDSGATPGDLLKLVGILQTAIARELGCSVNLVHMVAHRIPSLRDGKPKPNPTRSERVESLIVERLNGRLTKGRLSVEELFGPAER